TPRGVNPVASTNGEATPEAAAGAESLEQAVLRTLRRRWLTIFGLAAVPAVLGMLVTWSMLPSLYTARAVLQLSAQTPRGLFILPETTENYPAYQRTQATLIRSRHVLEGAVQLPEMEKLRHSWQKPVPWLADNVKVEPVSGTELLTISISGQRPEHLATI